MNKKHGVWCKQCNFIKQCFAGEGEYDCIEGFDDVEPGSQPDPEPEFRLPFMNFRQAEPDVKNKAYPEIKSQTGRKPGQSRGKKFDLEVFQFIVTYKRSHDGNSPTLREIGDTFGLHSTSYIDYILKKLERNGLIELSRVRARQIVVVGGVWNYIGKLTLDSDSRKI